MNTDPRLTDPDAAALMAAVPSRTPRHLAGIDEARRRVLSPEPAPDPRVVTTESVMAGVPVRVYRPAHGRERATVVYLHGGGWALGDLNINDNVCRALADRGETVVVSVDYRLAPEHPFPAALDDALRVREEAAQESSLPGPIVAAGLSAGGALAAALARRVPDVAHLLLFCPVLDCDLDRPSYRSYGTGLGLTRDDMAWFWDLYLPDPAARLLPDASPLRADDFTGTPPTTIVIAGADPLRDEAVEYATRLAAAGVDVSSLLVEGVPHGFVCMPSVASGARALNAAADRLRLSLPLLASPALIEGVTP